MSRIFIVHRWDGSPHADWYTATAAALTDSGHTCHVLAMPHPEAPEIGAWVGALTAAVGTPDANTFFIGHSVGCQTIMRYLETIATPVGGAVFVAGWMALANLEDKKAERIASPWLTTPINFEKIRAVLPHATAILSTNDPFVAFAEARDAFEKNLGAHVIAVDAAGHFTAEDGFTELPVVVAEFLTQSALFLPTIVQNSPLRPQQNRTHQTFQAPLLKQ